MESGPPFCQILPDVILCSKKSGLCGSAGQVGQSKPRWIRLVQLVLKARFLRLAPIRRGSCLRTRAFSQLNRVRSTLDRLLAEIRCRRDLIQNGWAGRRRDPLLIVR